MPTIASPASKAVTAKAFRIQLRSLPRRYSGTWCPSPSLSSIPEPRESAGAVRIVAGEIISTLDLLVALVFPVAPESTRIGFVPKSTRSIRNRPGEASGWVGKRWMRSRSSSGISTVRVNALAKMEWQLPTSLSSALFSKHRRSKSGISSVGRVSSRYSAI